MTTLKTNIAHRWTLTEFGQGDQQKRTIDLPVRDLVVGRASDVDVTINSAGVSKRHAQITFQDDQMIVQDLKSTNGTFVNSKRIDCCVTTIGDLLQFANALYRVGRRGDSQINGTVEEGILPWAQSLLSFERLINEAEVTPHFQPIIQLADSALVGYELLARSNLVGLTQPALMFGIAERLGQQAVLSELLRAEGMKVINKHRLSEVSIFLNTHPDEVGTDRLNQSLISLRNEFPELPMTIEIHEAAVTETQSMLQFRKLLGSLNIRLSYDDFGAGQGRLLELTEIPPDVLKFDMQLIRGIDSASAARQELLRALVRIAKESGTLTLAEGVETKAEHATCCELGFELGQGYLYGRPAPLNVEQPKN